MEQKQIKKICGNFLYALSTKGLNVDFDSVTFDETEQLTRVKFLNDYLVDYVFTLSVFPADNILKSCLYIQCYFAHDVEYESRKKLPSFIFELEDENIEDDKVMFFMKFIKSIKKYKYQYFSLFMNEDIWIRSKRFYKEYYKHFHK